MDTRRERKHTGRDSPRRPVLPAGPLLCVLLPKCSTLPPRLWVRKRRKHVVSTPTCLCSGATSHSWFLRVSAEPGSCSSDVLIRAERAATFKNRGRRASHLRAGCSRLPAGSQDPGNRGSILLVPASMLSFLSPRPLPRRRKKPKEKKKTKKRKSYDLLRNPKPNRKSLQG